MTNEQWEKDSGLQKDMKELYQKYSDRLEVECLKETGLSIVAAVAPVQESEGKGDVKNGK